MIGPLEVQVAGLAADEVGLGPVEAGPSGGHVAHGVLGQGPVGVDARRADEVTPLDRHLGGPSQVDEGVVEAPELVPGPAARPRRQLHRLGVGRGAEDGRRLGLGRRRLVVHAAEHR